ncbi:unnamed protein product [Rhizoctonia solani]|uniref:PNPLA domain-containing protein n=1 Tax=Rhizoctonia solani TaxID=456999 RepID=A0A8H3B2T4_9AGAM|nr:unnamed protein product [Rhizoctonia solani]
MAANQKCTRGLNVLCIDGGGARGLSSLVVLREIMHRINSKRGRDQVPLQPHEHFDMIAGAGTGGVSACMLGRLRMPINNAIEEYAALMESVFSEKKITGPTMYKGTRLQESLKTMIRDATGNEGEMLIEVRGKDESEKSMFSAVFAMARHNLNASVPVMFRSYDATSNPAPNGTIWQALYATMAHPDLFKGIDILDTSVPQSFIGGEIGCSNPLVHVLTEVKQIYPGHQVACVISIGAGHARTIQVPDPRWWQFIFRTQDVIVMKEMATDSERVAEDMAKRFQSTSGVYFRFNVDQGVQNMKEGCWERLGEVMGHTKAYLQKSATGKSLEHAVKASTERRCTVSTTCIDGQILLPGLSKPTRRLTSHKRCPPPTPVYTGREYENGRVIECIAGNQEYRRVCVVFGLGGVGKTQLVLSVIERNWDEWDYIIFVDASSKEAIEEGLKEFATAKRLGKTYEDAICWLQSCHDRWLLVFDNADTASTNIRQYIPGGQRGSILITTRLPDLARLAKGPDSVCRLSSMSNADGLALFLKTAHWEDHNLPKSEMNAAEALLKDFGCLALAIVHAGAYIAHAPGMTFTRYRNLFLSQRKRMLEQYNDLPASAKLDDYGKTVYTTWRMCYDQLRPESRSMLWLMAYLHYTDVFEDIFKRAAQNMGSHFDPLPLNDVESQARNHVKEFLLTFLDSDQRWDTVKFTNVMADLRLYSLIEFDRMNLAYSMHVLVQDWARTVTAQEPVLAAECSSTLISLSVDWATDTESLAFKRRLGLHVMSLLDHSPKIGVNHTYRFRKVCRCIGQWCLEEKLELQVLEAFKSEFGENSEQTLRSMGALARIYSQLGRWNEAEQIEVQVLGVSKQVLGEGHPETLIRVVNLAVTYSHLGRWEEAEKMHTMVLNTRKQLLGETHPDTLSSMAHLAMTYTNMGRLNEAEQLRAQVLEARKRVLGEEHPKTLNSMAHLALTHSRLGRWDEAISLLTTACTISQVQLGSEHPKTQEYLQWLAEIQRQKPAWL